MLLECPRCRVRVEPAPEAGQPRCSSCRSLLTQPRESEAPEFELEHLPTVRRVISPLLMK